MTEQVEEIIQLPEDYSDIEDAEELEQSEHMAYYNWLRSCKDINIDVIYNHLTLEDDTVCTMGDTVGLYITDIKYRTRRRGLGENDYYGLYKEYETYTDYSECSVSINLYYPIDKSQFGLFRRGAGFVLIWKGKEKNFRNETQLLRFFFPHWRSGELNDEDVARVAYIFRSVGIEDTYNQVSKNYKNLYIFDNVPEARLILKEEKLTGESGMFYDEEKKIVRLVEVIKVMEDSEYDMAAYEAYKETMPAVVDLAKLVGLSLKYRQGLKKLYVWLTGESDAGKTSIAKALGGYVWSGDNGFIKITRGTAATYADMKNSDGEKYLGLTIFDDLSTLKMPQAEAFKTYHSRGISVGSEAKRVTYIDDLTFLTSMGEEIFRNADMQIYNRVVHFPLELHTDKFKANSVWQYYYNERGNEALFFNEASKGLRAEMLKWYDSNAPKSELVALQEKYALDIDSNEYQGIIQKIKQDPYSYFKFTGDKIFNVNEQRNFVMKKLKKDGFKGDEDALWTDIKKLVLIKTTMRVKGEHKNCHKV